jgi:hypothetical protein
MKKLKSLFKGMKFFLNREVPRDQFVFAIRLVSLSRNTNDFSFQ